jgi:hypothetical protein
MWALGDLDYAVHATRATVVSADALAAQRATGQSWGRYRRARQCRFATRHPAWKGGRNDRNTCSETSLSKSVNGLPCGKRNFFHFGRISPTDASLAPLVRECGAQVGGKDLRDDMRQGSLASRRRPWTVARSAIPRSRSNVVVDMSEGGRSRREPGKSSAPMGMERASFLSQPTAVVRERHDVLASGIMRLAGITQSPPVISSHWAIRASPVRYAATTGCPKRSD